MAAPSPEQQVDECASTSGQNWNRRGVEHADEEDSGRNSRSQTDALLPNRAQEVLPKFYSLLKHELNSPLSQGQFLITSTRLLPARYLLAGKTTPASMQAKKKRRTKPGEKRDSQVSRGS